MNIGRAEREMFLLLLDVLERHERTFRGLAQQYDALLEVLKAQGTVTSAAYQAVLKELEAAGAVNDALDPREQERRALIARLREFLNKGPQ